MLPTCNKASEALVHEISDRSTRLVTNRSLLFASHEQKSLIKHPSTWNASLCGWWRIWLIPTCNKASGVLMREISDRSTRFVTNRSLLLASHEQKSLISQRRDSISGETHRFWRSHLANRPDSGLVAFLHALGVAFDRFRTNLGSSTG